MGLLGIGMHSLKAILIYQCALVAEDEMCYL